MNITKSNFNTNIDLVVESINEADYISLDTEFTGLSDGRRRIHQYESLEDRYQKIKSHIEKFWVCQLGLATFKYSEEQGAFVSKIFNIYLYPTHRPLNVSMSSMSFLVENGFDMNLMFKEAISCDRPMTNNWNNKDSRNGHFELSDKNQQLLNSYETQILEFMNSQEKSTKILLPDSYIKQLFFGSHGVARLFKYLEIKADKQEPLLVLIKRSGKKVAEYLRKSDTPVEPEQKASISSIISALLSKRAPLIGHYMILDMAFFYDHFIAPLPDTLEEFRKSLLSLFPSLYDTKYITKCLFSKVKFIKKSSVEDLYSYCKKRKELNTIVNISVDPSFAITQQAHDAGFDAYMTGYIFITLLKYLPDPNEIEVCKGKICVQGHYKEFIDVNQENVEDFNFQKVIKIRTSRPWTVQEVGRLMSKYADNFVLQEEENAFFVEFYQTEDMGAILVEINGMEGFKAASFIDRNLI